MHFDRSEYSEIYHQVFGKKAGREACHKGWERWQQVLARQDEKYPALLVINPPGASVPSGQASDYYILAFHGPLMFQARASAEMFATLPGQWVDFCRDGGKLEKYFSRDARAMARSFVHNSLVDGYVLDPNVGPRMAAAIVWLLANSGVPIPITTFHFLGYDITHVPGPPEQARMFNFRAILNLDREGVQLNLDTLRSLPLPGWHPPPEEGHE